MSTCCNWCNKEFTPHRSGVKHCSKRCGNRFRYHTKKKHSSEYIAHRENYRVETRTKNTLFVRRYKTFKGCTDCGYKEHFMALDLDHLKDKLRPISGFSNRKRLKEEIRKCEVVCTRCHMIRTYNRLQVTKLNNKHSQTPSAINQRMVKDKISRFIRKYKVLVGCTDCGYKEHYNALEFDHMRDKIRTPGKCRSLKSAKAEIQKCQVRCSNCHRIKTYNERKLAGELLVY